MTVTADQIQKAKSYGMNHIDIVAKACDETGARFYMTLAMLEKETGTVRNVYGHDQGGALSGFPGEVNEDNYAVFRWLIFNKNMISNGVGPAQLTFKPFFTDMEERGLKPWDLYDNIRYGAELVYKYYRYARDTLKLSVDKSLEYAGTKYNGSSTYGVAYAALAAKWKARVGWADYA